ncbi:hypothetical protein FQN60_007805, partial [Etheostoma spectabile]
SVKLTGVKQVFQLLYHTPNSHQNRDTPSCLQKAEKTKRLNQLGYFRLYQNKMKKFLLLLLFCHVSSPVKYSLKYFITASSGLPNFPEFVATGLVDDLQWIYCNSNKKIIEPKLDWVKDLYKDNPQ